MLSRETCVRLRNAGFDQTIRCGDWFYRKREQPDMGRGEVWTAELWCGDNWNTKRTDILKIPQTGELIDAVVEIVEVMGWRWFNLCYNCETKGWLPVIERTMGQEYLYGVRYDRDEALSALYEKLAESSGKEVKKE